MLTARDLVIKQNYHLSRPLIRRFHNHRKRMTQQRQATLSAADFRRQSAAFRMFSSGVPGVRFCTKSGAFKASFVGSEGKLVKLGSFESVGDAVTAISRAYATVTNEVANA
ncbi:hypothetical protein [Paraburkholderia strydomiana]|uniref:hypothetical protein n=1 Tax=Paraburkholderia strydomiana TaxID=1245417 RepID=UPI0038B87EA3